MRALVLLLAAAASAAEPSPPSTAPARAEGPVFGAPLRLRLRFDDRGRARGELGFTVRWEAADIPKLPGAAARLALDPFGTTERAAREALSGADFGVHTLRFRAGQFLPVGLLLSPLTLAADILSPPRAVYGAVAEGEPPPRPPPDPRRRLALTPARAEIERGLKRDLRRSLIEAGFDLAVPVNQKVPFSQKQALYESVLKAGEAIEEDLELP